MSECIFCQIVDKTIPAKLIYEDDLVVAFDDLYPKAPQHKLIVPRKHIATLNDLDDNDAPLAGHLLITAEKLAKQLGIAETGYRVSVNCNKWGGQEIYHLHLHLLGGRAMQWPPG